MDTRKAVYATITFFSIFERPITKEEIRQYLYQATAGKVEVEANLDQLVKEGLVAGRYDFYTLKDHTPALKAQKNKFEISTKLLKKACRWAKVLKMAPFVRAIIVTNSVAMHNADEKSDIDLVIVADKNIYIAKSFIWTLLNLFNQYEKKDSKSTKFSLGYAFSTDNLDLSRDNFKHPDPIAYYTTAMYLPLFSIGGYENLIRKNRWVSEKLPNFRPYKNYDQRKSLLQLLLESFLKGKPGEWIEKKLADIHIKHTWSLPENHWKSAYTIATTSRLKLNAIEASTRVKHEFNARLKAL